MICSRKDRQHVNRWGVTGEEKYKKKLNKNAETKYTVKEMKTLLIGSS